jgi:hypothetical protein
MIDGPSVNRHHWVPKSKGGRLAASLHVVCHRMLHRVFSETDLAATYNTPEAVRTQPEMARFVAWVRRKPTDFVDWANAPAGRDTRRPHRRRKG